MTPERYAKILGHHKAGAYAVATLDDVDGLRVTIDLMRTELDFLHKVRTVEFNEAIDLRAALARAQSERDGWAEQAPKTNDMLLGVVAEQRARADRAEEVIVAIAEAAKAFIPSFEPNQGAMTIDGRTTVLMRALAGAVPIMRRLGKEI